jgi:hypothetical protein
MKLPFAYLPVFAATRLEQVPQNAHCFIAVDGAVPRAALTWDHHQTGEPINLDAMPAQFTPTPYDAIATTLPDTDALASIIAVWAGGKMNLPEDILEILLAASYRCDHLIAHPKVSAQADHQGHRLHTWVMEQLRISTNSSEIFHDLCKKVAEAIETHAPLPGVDPITPLQVAQVQRLLRKIQQRGTTAFVDMQDEEMILPDLVYTHLPDIRVMIWRYAHPSGGHRYTVGINPFHTDHPQDLRPLLKALAVAELAHGLPCKGLWPEADAENWGGRTTVFGSPWNYGSRLEPTQVLNLVGSHCDVTRATKS